VGKKNQVVFGIGSLDFLEKSKRNSTNFLIFLLILIFSLGNISLTSEANDTNIYNNISKKYVQKLRDINKKIKTDPKNSEYFYTRSIIYFRLDNCTNAIASINEAIELNPKKSIYYSARGNLYYLTNDFKSAIESYSEAIKLDPKNAALFSDRGTIYSIKKDYNRALQDFNKAIEYDAINSLFFLKRSDVWRSKDDYINALADINKAISLSPNLDIYYAVRASLFYKEKGDINKAFDDIDKAIRLNPNNPSNYILRGWFLCYGKGEYKKAVENYKKAIDLSPKNLSYCTDLICIFYLMGEYDEVLRQIKIIHSKFALKEYLFDQQLSFLSYFIAIEKGEYVSTLDNLKATSFILNKTPDYNFCLGKIYFMLNQFNQAEKYLKNILNSDTISITQRLDHYMILLKIYRSLNKFESSKIIMIAQNIVNRKSEEVKSDKWFWFSNLAQIYAEEGNLLKKAMLLSTESVKNRPCWDSYYSLGFIYYKMQNYIMAIRAFEKTQALNPNNAWVWYYLGLARKGRGQINAAKYSWEQGLKINPNHRFIKDELKKIK